MVRVTSSKKSRLAWIVMHGGFLAWGICLIVLAEEQRDGGDEPARNAKKRPPSEVERDNSQGIRSEGWIEAQIENLGDPNYGVRVKAARQLLAAGPEAVDPLAKALSSADPEIARRSQSLLSQLVRDNDACLAALEHIARLPEHPSAPLAQVIQVRESNRREHLRMAVLQEHP
jgi:hypothetical protein